ncbi:MAG: exodeoxyribonuclease V subunit gamma [Desulfobacterales bacterium]|uniref:Exodeoxyribonuclease V subunit gamma n=1 Tax=Candidatus Desulfaltia bathyphila TaxID=2841697 RepID=A0A8J6N5M2_9BACT|nr:exodeoxyribonuclease V subunit gamma [Candidatus Desulfaltia bathyphila]MBL7195648.1 exodeoxyribonuclease V subunit gamma [Desulfobacterales bacterium]MBL7207832.1 exodeoxyribonuclease V subunit gamma [Desulfobacterales bacterium]
MSIQLYFSNRLDKLAEQFALMVDLENRRKENVFKAPLVIAPNANLIKWLQLVLAKKRFICMNMDFQFLETGLWSLLANLDTEKLNPKLLDNDCLQMLLLYALQNLDENRIQFEPINHYLLNPDNIKRPDYTVRLWQLSEKFARLFQEYEFNRWDMIQKWRQNKVLPKGMELCQQKLYLLTNKLRDKLFNKSNSFYLSMMEYADRLLAGKSEKKKIAVNGNNFVHFFGLSQISPFHLQLIGRLKDYYEIFIYAFNPSREFWEDIKTPQEKRWILRKNLTKLAIKSEEKDQGELFVQDDNELLSLWGKPGRESIRLLCELTDYDFHACFAKEKTPATVLQRIQSDILTLPSKKAGPKQDRSLQIVACPGIYREVETVYNSILYNLEQDNGLQLTDIAILVPDISKYKFVFDSVFNRSPKSLSYNLVDSHAEIESIFGRGVLSIFDFATGRFSRREVFDLILNPCFMSKWKIGFEEIRAWAYWAQELNIFHDFDQRSKKEKGYCESPYYTWKQGLQRLRLSRIMSNPVESKKAVSGSFKHFQDIVPYFDLNTGDVHLMEKFCIVIEKLNNVAIYLNDVPLSGKEWNGRFLEACDELLDIPSDFAGETEVKHSLINALDNLQFYDAISEDDEDSKLDIEMIKEFIKSRLSSISGGYGDYLTGGVTISALQPMRPIPFKIVYVLGMEEGSFPGKAESSSLDLRLLKRRIGDISQPERNCYIFLEMLLSTRDKLYISYISKDLQKDRILQPCSVVNQLRRYIEGEILPAGQLLQTAEIPLKGSSNRYLDKDSVNECFDVMVNYSMADRLTYYRENKLWRHVKEKALKNDLNNAAAFYPDLKHEIEAVEDEDIIAEKITLKQLKKFLEDPVSQSIKHNLGIYDEKESVEEIVLSEDEPFYSDFPIDYRLKMEPLKQWLDSFFSSKGNNADAKEIEEIYNLAYNNFLRQSKTPEGLFAALDKNELKDEVLKKAETISSVLKGIRSSNALYRAFYIGEPEDDYSLRISQGVVKYFSPLTLTVKATNSRSEDIQRKVELHGQLPWVWKENGDEWHALVLSGSYNKPGKKPDKYILEPVLFYVFSLCGVESSKWIGNRGITFHIVYNEQVRSVKYSIDKKLALDYLADLLSDYLSQKELQWMPFKDATSGDVKPHEIAENKITEDIKTYFQIQLAEALSKDDADLIKLAKPEIPSNAFDKARQRFKIFFNHINGNEGKAYS